MLNSRFTKIIATLGPATQSKIMIARLIKNGVNVFRLNMKHNSPSWHQNLIKQVEMLNHNQEHKVGIMVDLQGPEIRLETNSQQSFLIKKGEEVMI